MDMINQLMIIKKESRAKNICLENGKLSVIIL